MKKTVSKLLVSVLSVILAILLVIIPASASTKIGSTEVTTGALWWKQYYRYDAYEDYSCVMCYRQHKLSNDVWHQCQGNASPYLDCTLSVTDGYEKTFSSTVEWNTSIGCTATIEIVQLSTEKGYGSSVGVSFAFSRSTTYTKNIYSNFPTGTYFLAPAQHVYKCFTQQYKKNDAGTYINQNIKSTYYMPDGCTYIGTFYAPTATSGYYVAP